MKLFALTFICALICLVAADYHHEEHYHPHKYDFEYGVKDGHTKDIHSAWEKGYGSDVTGEYQLHEADGTQRVVEYKTDKHGGWQPHVKRIGHAVHPHHGTSYANHNHYYHHGHGGY